MQEIIEKIRQVAAKNSLYDADGSFDLSDYHGGNYDDAYSLGLDEGETGFARELLKMLDKIPG